jgi:hypothetical protein
MTASIRDAPERFKGGALDPAFGQASVSNPPDHDPRERHRPVISRRPTMPLFRPEQSHRDVTRLPSALANVSSTSLTAPVSTPWY